MRFSPLIGLSLFVCAASAHAQSAKPVLMVAKDGFPSGHASPEGAATDFARAFIRRDDQLFRDICIKPYGGGVNRKQYVGFLDEMVKRMKAESKRTSPSPGGPKTIIDVFAARHLSLGGPASYGYATFGFKDVEFVDVHAQLYNGRKIVMRTFVIEGPDGKWYVHPAPDISPLLSAGLNTEKPSTQDIAAAYTLKAK